MVNSTLVTDEFQGRSSNQTCAVRTDDETEDEFAIPGTMEWSSAEQSLLTSSRFYGGCLTVAFSGLLTDRFGADAVMRGSLILSSLLTLVVPVLAYANFYALLVSRIALGGIESLHIPSMNCVMARWFPAGEKATAASISSMGIQLAGGLAALYAASLCRSSLLGGWPSIYYVFGESLTFRAGSAPLGKILRSSAVHSIIIGNYALFYNVAIMQAFLPLFLRELGLPIETIGWYTSVSFLSQIAGKAVIGPLIDYTAGKGMLTLTTATKIAQCFGAFGSAIPLLLLSTVPSCDNANVTGYILLAYGLVYAGSSCSLFSSILTISPANVATLSAMTGISRIVASVASTTIVNALTASEITYKWPLIFASAAIFQCIAGVHFLFFGTTEEQPW
ncbi:hypothetical protein PRIPAC_78756 [Pristionchus pacificus]|uniref:Membrane transporter n=1 Tax=Pristionchus pacificus TaxID=54126 RepID=A0A2A6CQJ2_PRIPA|nr:hypothetical protein PRIPAC_78756 [Pristionchus pacificus]|eukprot:PDM80301.1 membrane transporter [Pristionchus pacificus]